MPEEITAQSVGGHAVMGTAKQYAEHLRHLHEDLGVDDVVFCCPLSTGPSLTDAREQVLRFGEDVVPPSTDARSCRPSPRPAGGDRSE